MIENNKPSKKSFLQIPWIKYILVPLIIMVIVTLIGAMFTMFTAWIQEIGFGEALGKVGSGIRSVLTFGIPLWIFILVVGFFFYLIKRERKRSQSKKENETERKKMEEKAIEKLKALVKRTKELKYNDNNELDKIKWKAKMVIKNLPEDYSYYIDDLNNIHFVSLISSSGIPEFEEDMEFAFGEGSSGKSENLNEREIWEKGKEKLINLFKTIIEDLNY